MTENENVILLHDRSPGSMSNCASVENCAYGNAVNLSKGNMNDIVHIFFFTWKIKEGKKGKQTNNNSNNNNSKKKTRKKILLRGFSLFHYPLPFLLTTTLYHMYILKFIIFNNIALFFLSLSSVIFLVCLPWL